MKVIGLDSSMNHTGYSVLQFDPHALITNPPTPHPTHGLLELLDGGTFNYDDSSEARLDRLVKNVVDIHNLVSRHKPDIVVIEGALDKGRNRSPTGVALYALITVPWHPCRQNLWGLTPNDNYFIPEGIISISPERHMSVAHQKRKLTGTEKVKRYRDVAAQLPKGRYSEHQADSYFIAYHGHRFWTTLRGIWPKTILTPNEMAIFFDCQVRHPKTNRRLASKSMINEEGRSWWTQTAPAVITDETPGEDEVAFDE